MLFFYFFLIQNSKSKTEQTTLAKTRRQQTTTTASITKAMSTTETTTTTSPATLNNNNNDAATESYSAEKRKLEETSPDDNDSKKLRPQPMFRYNIEVVEEETLADAEMLAQQDENISGLPRFEFMRGHAAQNKFKCHGSSTWPSFARAIADFIVEGGDTYMLDTVTIFFREAIPGFKIGDTIGWTFSDGGNDGDLQFFSNCRKLQLTKNTEMATKGRLKRGMCHLYKM